MSKIPRNKKYLELEGIRVYHDKKDGSIQLISTDSDLKGKPFHITLNQGTQTERSVRELLMIKGVITPEQYNPQEYLPKIVPSSVLEEMPTNSYSWDEVPVGVNKNSETVTVLLKSSPHVLITGMPGSGKTVLVKNFLLHALKRTDKWQVAAVDLRDELSPLFRSSENIYGSASTLDEVINLFQQLNATVAYRLNMMENQNVNSFSELEGEDLPAIMVVLDEVLLFLSEEGRKGEEPETWSRKIRMIQALLYQMISKAETVGLQIILTTKWLDSKVLPKDLIECFSNHVIVGPVDREDSRRILHTDAATQTASIPGRSLLLKEGHLTALQVFAVNQQDITEELLRH